MASEPITIPEAPKNPYKQIEHGYDHQHASLRCPNCGRWPTGVVWGGWFSCEDCYCIALYGPEGRGGGVGPAFIPFDDEPGPAAHLQNEFVEPGAGI